MNSLTIPPVMYIPLDPGQSHEDTRRLELPLKSYNAMSMTDRLDKRMSQAILIVQPFVGEPESWCEVDGEDGPIHVPDRFSARDLSPSRCPCRSASLSR